MRRKPLSTADSAGGEAHRVGEQQTRRRAGDQQAGADAELIDHDGVDRPVERRHRQEDADRDDRARQRIAETGDRARRRRRRPGAARFA